MRLMSVPALLLTVRAVCQDPLTVDLQHYKVELENPWVRVLRVHYAPGEGSPMHEHSAGVRVFLADIRNRFTAPDGTTTDSSHRAGDVTWAEKVRHANRIVSEFPVEMIELELKQVPAGPAQALSKTAAPDSAETVLIENNAVRVLQTKLAPGQATASHRLRHSVAISIQPNLSGKGPAPASVAWLPEGEQVLSNPASQPLTLIVVELKITSLARNNEAPDPHRPWPLRQRNSKKS